MQVARCYSVDQPTTGGFVALLQMVPTISVMSTTTATATATTRPTRMAWRRDSVNGRPSNPLCPIGRARRKQHHTEGVRNLSRHTMPRSTSHPMQAVGRFLHGSGMSVTDLHGRSCGQYIPLPTRYCTEVPVI